MRFKICLEDIEQTEEDLLVSNDEIELVEPYVEDHQRMKSLDEAFESVQLLEETIAIIQQNPEGLNPAGLKLVQRNHNLACSATGIKNVGSIYPSTENLRSISARQYNTRVALEGLKDTVMRIFHAIKNAIKSVIDWFLNFFRSVDHAFKSSLKKIHTLKDYVKAQDKKLEFSPNGKFQNAVAISKLKSSSKGDVEVGMRNLEGFVDVVIKTIGQYTAKNMQQTLGIVEKIVFEKEQPITAMPSPMPDPGGFSEVNIPNYLTPKDMLSTQYEHALPGMTKPSIFDIDYTKLNKDLVYKEALNIYAQSKFFFAVDPQGLINPQEIPFLTKDKLYIFLGNMQNICEKYLLNSESFKTITEGKKKLDKLITVYLDKESKKPKEDKNQNEFNKPTDQYDKYGFKETDTDMFRFSYMIRCFNSYLDNVPVKMITNTAKLTQEALYYGIAFASDNVNALKAK